MRRCVSQAISGYYHFELIQYAEELYLIVFSQVMIFALAAFFIQTIVSNKFIGHGIVIGLFLLTSILDTAGINDRLYIFGDVVNYTYSDMNGYGHFVQPLVWSTFYWLSWSVLLGVLASLLARRGSETGLKARLSAAKQSLPSYAVLLILPLLAAAGSGAWFFYNTHVLNTFRTDRGDRRMQADYERLIQEIRSRADSQDHGRGYGGQYLSRKSQLSADGHLHRRQRNRRADPRHLPQQRHSFRKVHQLQPPGDRSKLSRHKRGFWIYHLATPLKPNEHCRSASCAALRSGLPQLQ